MYREESEAESEYHSVDYYGHVITDSWGTHNDINMYIRREYPHLLAAEKGCRVILKKKNLSSGEISETASRLIRIQNALLLNILRYYNE